MQTINYNGYEITIEHNKVSGMYRLSTWASEMGEEYLETLRCYDKPTEAEYQKLIAQVERNK